MTSQEASHIGGGASTPTTSSTPVGNAPTSNGKENSVIELKSKTMKSEVWNHFERIFEKPEDKKFKMSKCVYCKMIYSGNTGTSTLMTHLLKCRSYPYNKMPKKQKTLELFKDEEGESKITSWKFDQVECRKALGQMIIIDELPFNFVEHQGFRHFCSVAVPRFQFVSRVTIARDCLKIYADLKRQLKVSLAFNAQRVCLTTDIWTSLQNLSYMVLTAHFIDQNWKLNKRILNFFPILSHKGVAIGSAIETCMIDWGIQKVLTLTVDNASSNDTAIAHLQKKLIKNNVFVLDGEYLHMRCCAHILNLIVRDGMKEESGSIERIRLAVKYIRGSPQRAEQFKICCDLDRIPFKNNLVLDVPTRWNYTYLMLETALKFKKAFDRYEDVDRNFLAELDDKAPTNFDWNNAMIFCKFLKTFYDVTNRLSGSLYVTSNSYFRDVILIQSTIKSWSNSKDETLKLMSVKMGEKFNKYWGDVGKMNMMLLIAVVLDPCFKLGYVLFCYDKIYSNEVVKELENKLRDTLRRLYDYYHGLDSSSKSDEHDDSSLCMNIDQVGNLGDGVVSYESEFLRHVELETKPSKSELEAYLEEDCVKKVPGEQFDILNWWKVNSSRFRVLSLMARDVLAIPVSTVASESAFSTGGRILDQFRSSLTPKVVEALICAQDWLRASPLPIEIEARLDEMVDLESTISEDPSLASAFTTPLS